MDIVEQARALNERITALETINAKQAAHIETLEASITRNQENAAVELSKAKEALELEVQRHVFTAMQLEDEKQNVEMGVKVLRELQTSSSDIVALRAFVQEKDATIARMQQELIRERESRATMEQFAQQAIQAKENEISMKTALRAMISVLTGQLRHKDKQIETTEQILLQQRQEIERKVTTTLTEFTPATESPTSPTPSQGVKDSYVIELDNRFKAILDLIEAVEGKTLTFDAATGIKSAIREAKQVIGEELIIAHANLELVGMLRHNEASQLENEKKNGAQLLAIVSDLQAQLDTLINEQVASDSIQLSFVSKPATVSGNSA